MVIVPGVSLILGNSIDIYLQCLDNEKAWSKCILQMCMYACMYVCRVNGRGILFSMMKGRERGGMGIVVLFREIKGSRASKIEW